MNNDPLITGSDSSFPNINSSSVPTVWEEDMVQAAEQGIGCAAGPMLTLTKKSTDQQFLPGGAFNPCREFSPVPETLVVENLRVDAGVTRELAAARIASGTRGVVGNGTTQGVNGTGTGAGSFGVVGVGATAGVWGGAPMRMSGGMGVVGRPGPDFISRGVPTTPWAGRFDGPVWVRTIGGASGDLTVDGSLLVWGSTKASVVPHPDGSQRVMHSMEAPESWFEDIGRAQLREGAARVDIDPDFAAVSGLGNDYHVFLTAEGPSNGLYVSDRTSTGFEVREQGEATSEITFSYRIITKGTNGRAGRLEAIELPSDAGQKAAGEPAELPPHGVPTSPEQPESAPPA
jgi:hypothetical protein